MFFFSGNALGLIETSGCYIQEGARWRSGYGTTLQTGRSRVCYFDTKGYRSLTSSVLLSEEWFYLFYQQMSLIYLGVLC